ncbi:HNH endonuclease [Gordonia phage Thimann]|uniref:HNH endonuclease n=3 Tax=Beenievirus TaxID=3044673 RepID=A0A514DI98_9CAUD|nr:HNH endonuclease [Gordonia phage Sekhmet]YP_010654168.1 HNH endonuclease [Gordonia phage Dolores]YP_010654474.1 HNH endonuclease [Gordonia phage Samman98]URM87903.1 HNH endonuclease [Gordonia phage WinkNick]WNM74265.1 HNH endonuclease [Gordonia phage Thimann]QDH93339.1 HNH endonuclease [Gordonia phage Sekhmet]QYC54480.1 HNH endonuclease [Gordonia phage Samman98]UAJ16432.1 HNH endonuclease [Gordonia phage Dolores]
MRTYLDQPICRPCRAEKRRADGVEKTWRPVAKRSCGGCGKTIYTYTDDPRCNPCRKVNAAPRIPARDKQRAEYWGVDYEHVVRARVYERDGWECGICHTPVDHDLEYPHPESASLDHIHPMSLGGAHSYANTQLAHLRCNIVKANRVGGEQLAFLG